MKFIYSTLIFSIALAVTLFGISQIVRRKRTHVNYYLASSFFALSYILLYNWIVYMGYIHFFSILVYSDIGFTLLVAPAIYLSFISILREERGPLKSYKRHLILPIFVLFCFFLYNIVNYSQIPNLLISQFDHYRTPFILFISVFSDSVLLGYIISTIIQAFFFWKNGEIKRIKEFKIILIFLVILFIGAFFLILSYFSGEETPLILFTSFFGLIVLVYSLVCFRIPDYSQGSILKKSSRGNVLLNTQERIYYVKKISRLMLDQEIFRDPELTLPLLAKKMSISSNELSQLINMEMHMNFRAYINTIRLNNIRKELVSIPEKTILEIAFDNGFNSKSSFNTLFRKEEGISPREYRKKINNQNLSSETTPYSSG